MGKATPSVLFAVLSIGLGGSAARAARVAPQIPPPLRPWAEWVLDSEEGQNAHCPAHAGESAPVCAWASRLALDLGERSGSFKQEWTIFREGFVALPGNKDHWPREIKVDGQRAPTVDHSGAPQVFLRVGRHAVTGGFLWDSLPESLMVPSETGLVALTVQGKPIAFPMRENDGRVFLGKNLEEKAEEEKVDISVYRKLCDTVPLGLTTRLTLAVSGKSREIELARALPDGFEPRSVESKLPLRFEGDGRIRVQARPGVWDIELGSHRVVADKSIVRPVPEGLWKEGDEVWVFEAAPDLRTVTVTGAPSIDPAQTLMPGEWKSLPAYAMAPGAVLTLVEQRRGDAEPPPERLSLERTLWLDANGRGFSVHDTVAGEFTRAWRLEVGEGTRLGRLAIDGQDQFITRMGAAGRDGVELRSGRATIDADSRIENRAWALPATSFAHDFDRLSATLNLPAGWDLFHAAGADQVSGSWVERWSLGQLFLLLLLVLAIGRLYGFRLGALALLALGITLVDGRAPAIVWLFVIAGEVLVRLVKQEPVLIAARVVRAAMWLVLLIATVPFAVAELRFAMHPASATDRGPERRFVSQDAISLGGQRFVSYALKGQSLGEQEPAENVMGSIFGREDASNAGILGVLHKGEEGKMGGKGQGYGRRGVAQQGLYGLKGPKDNPDPQLAKRLAEYDPSIVVQTGEGLPRQAWRSANLAWNGPVKSDQQLRLYLVPPWLGRILALAQVGLLIALGWLLLRRPLRLRGDLVAPRSLLAGLAMLVLLAPMSASAVEFPPKEILDSLKERLLQVPDCAPDCVAIGEMAVDVTPARLHVSLQVSTAAPTAIALPGDSASWSPTGVRIDGNPAVALERASSGQLWLALPAGIFTVDLAGPLPGRDSIQIPLPMPPRRATFKARGFELSGIHEDGAVDESISLARIASTKEGGNDFTESAPTLPPFLRVARTLKLGLKWEVETTVTRETGAGAPLVIEIPLLPGESVTTADIRTEKTRGTVSLSLAPGEANATWKSTLAESRAIALRVDPKTASRWSEIWRAEVSPIWHATFAGIPPVRRDSASSTRTPEWRPWPGEEVHIAIDKPGGVTGRTLTIDASTLNVEPGLRSTQLGLVLELRSSRGTEHTIGLPAGAEVTSTSRDNVPQPIRRQGQDLILSIPPGKHTINVNWRQSVGVSSCFRAPAVDLRAPSTNSTVNLTLMEEPRWVLWLAGPFVGPVVGWWAVLAIVLLASIVLARTLLTPLRTHHWLLLGLGLTQIDPVASLFVVACLLCLGWRARMQANEARPAFYDLGQIALAVLILVSVYACVSVIDMGLGRLPDMFITGNQAAGNQLTWLQDRADPTLARPWVLSVPRWGYRLFIVAWALWLVVAALRWAPWVWSCLKQHGLWKPIAKPFTIPPRGA